MKRQVLLPAFAWCASVLWAHPMGNSSVSHYSRIELTPTGARIRCVLDLAEIPAAELLQRWGPNADLERMAEGQDREWARGLKLAIGGRAVAPILEHASATLDKGTLRVAMDLRVDSAPGTLRYEDHNFPDRPGWKEIVAPGAGQDR